MSGEHGFAARVVAWQRTHGRHDLPWQGTRDPYRLWVSEIMLQQTQVAAVIPYYQRFMARFPDVGALAAAPLDAVLEHWSGLGYYSRARNLHAAACMIAAQGGAFPRDAEGLAAMPGVGRSTAAAIAAFAYGERAAILDGNVRRVLCRFFGVEGFPGQPAVERALWALAERVLPPAGQIAPDTQGLLDLGATVCTRGRPRCGACPLAGDCIARATDRVAELPAPRPRRAVPLRETTMLVLRQGARVLLEKRPPRGIWGGLWSLPELSGPEQAAVAAGSLGLRVQCTQPLPDFVHAFTHFRLHVRPLLLEVEPAVAAIAREEDGAAARRWLPLDEAAAAALPQPVKTLLLSIPGAG